MNVKDERTIHFNREDILCGYNDNLLWQKFGI